MQAINRKERIKGTAIFMLMWLIASTVVIGTSWWLSEDAPLQEIKRLKAQQKKDLKQDSLKNTVLITSIDSISNLLGEGNTDWLKKPPVHGIKDENAKKQILDLCNEIGKIIDEKNKYEIKLNKSENELKDCLKQLDRWRQSVPSTPNATQGTNQ